MKIVRFIGKLVIAIVVVVMISLAIRIYTHGMWLFLDLKKEDVASVELIELDEPKESLVVTDPEKIEISVNISNMLNYEVFTKADTEDQPEIAMIYVMKDDSRIELFISKDSVWKDGKQYTLKEKELGYNIIEGLFFDQD